MYIEYNNKKSEMFSCDFCNSIIEPGTYIQKGFDCTFCSTNCRETIANLNISWDPKLSNYKLWYKSKPEKIVIESTLKRTLSMVNIRIKEKDTNQNSTFQYLILKLKQCNFPVVAFTMLVSTVFVYK